MMTRVESLTASSEAGECGVIVTQHCHAHETKVRIAKEPHVCV